MGRKKQPIHSKPPRTLQDALVCIAGIEEAMLLVGDQIGKLRNRLSKVEHRERVIEGFSTGVHADPIQEEDDRGTPTCLTL